MIIYRAASPVFLIHEELVFSRPTGFFMSFRIGSTPLEEKLPRGLIWIMFPSKGNGILNDAPGEAAGEIGVWWKIRDVAP